MLQEILFNPSYSSFSVKFPTVIRTLSWRFFSVWFPWESFLPCSRYIWIREYIVSCGYQRVAVHQNSPQKCAQPVEKPPRYSENREEIIAWKSAYRRTPQQSSKTYSAGRKRPCILKCARKLSEIGSISYRP